MGIGSPNQNRCSRRSGWNRAKAPLGITLKAVLQVRTWKLTKVEHIQLTYQISDIIEQKCRRCHYNRTDDTNFRVTVCTNCPTGQELR
ncbi:hypothetical protein CN553_26655 [Bacillus cereus]|uniref:Uncharacterized protein n=1 Tax=Bacillus cereus TaxID=1396 RepID=A0A9X6U709_BACCE|nr:hypothetical protein [Bacillus cereus]PEN85547.1 hypothetical protein CN553_26655 [Bacillus cereus]